MARYLESKPLPIAQQKAELLLAYHDLVTMERNRNIVDCQIRLHPTENSREYIIRIRYEGHGRPQAWLIDSPLKLVEGKKPHHIYGENQCGQTELCVFKWDLDKWDSQKSLATVFVPWVITWLYAYEIWQITGEWIYPEASTGEKE